MSPRAPANTIPCPRCGRPLRRTATGTPRRIGCARCRFLLYDYPRLCSGVVVIRRGDVLVLRRAHRPRVGWLDLPGGFLDAGESLEQAARRELREETGLAVGPLTPLGEYWDRYYLRGFGYFPTLNAYFLARWRSGVPVAADDAASTEWVPLRSLTRPRARLAWAHMGTVLRAVARARGVRRRG